MAKNTHDKHSVGQQVDLPLEVRPEDYEKLIARWKQTGRRCELTLLAPGARNHTSSYSVRCKLDGSRNPSEISLRTTCPIEASARRYAVMRRILDGGDLRELSASWNVNSGLEANILAYCGFIFLPREQKGGES